MSFSRRQWIITGALTVGCLGAYLALRSVPVEACEILHYGDYVNADGVIEGCGFEETGFFDLDELRYPVIARLTALDAPEVGQTTRYTLQLETSTGRPIGSEDLAITHTERLHAMVVNTSLSDYQHLHPAPAGPGTWTFEHTALASGAYRVYLDFVPLRTARRTLVGTTFTVPGEPIAESPTAPQKTLSQRTASGLTVTLVPAPDLLRAGEDIPFHLEISGPGPLVFDPVMDSYAHLVAFAPGRNGFAHFHPRDPYFTEQDPRSPALDFLFSVEEPGAYRVWAQFSVNGQEQFVPFDLMVEAAG